MHFGRPLAHFWSISVPFWCLLASICCHSSPFEAFSSNSLIFALFFHLSSFFHVYKITLSHKTRKNINFGIHFGLILDWRQLSHHQPQLVNVCFKQFWRQLSKHQPRTLPPAPPSRTSYRLHQNLPRTRSGNLPQAT